MGDAKRPPRQVLTDVEGRAIAEDLRLGRRDRVEDMRFPEGFQLQVGTMRGVTFSNCQLWLALGGGMFRDGVMDDCRFVDVDLDPLAVRGADVRDTTFERVTFGLTAVGGIDDSQIEGGAFTDCRLLDFGFRRTTFSDVRVDAGRMDRVRFDACSFTDVRIAGALKDVDLRGCAFDRSDISASDVIDVTLSDWRSADLRLPGRRTGFFVTPAAVSEVLAAMPADLTAPFRDDVFRGVVLAGFDLIAVSERFFTNALGAEPREASILVDALFPHRLEALGPARPTSSPSGRPSTL
jgi:hypothetical protein